MMTLVQLSSIIISIILFNLSVYTSYGSHTTWSSQNNKLETHLTKEDIDLAQNGLAPPLGHYFERSYKNITEELKYLADSEQCRNIFVLTTAQELYPDIILDDNFFTCNHDHKEKCKTHIIRVGSEKKDNQGLPEIFLSGAVHGNERVGPNVLVELLRLLCHMYGRHPIITYMVDTRVIWLAPMTNAWGYAHKRREEYHVDPNRDFPYLKDSTQCMRTITARALNELFRSHLFQLSITFHGGTRIIGYEWGSFDHIEEEENNLHRLNNFFSSEEKPMHSKESPDFISQREIGKALQQAAGRLDTVHPFERKESYGYRRRLENSLFQDDNTSLFYPTGPMSDLVYPVNGGLEDWSYAATWESNTTIAACNPSVLGGYPEWKTKYRNNEGLRCSTFLVETDYLKQPPDWQYGHSAEVMTLGGLDGHVSRNLRLSLKLIELVEPDILLLSEPTLDYGGQENSTLQLNILPVGCQRLSTLEALFLNGSCQEKNFIGNYEQDTLETQFIRPMSNVSCIGLGLWEGWGTNTISEETIQHYKVGIPINSSRLRKSITSSSSAICFILRASFDQHWIHQTNPDPQCSPQSHIVRARTLENYDVESIDGESFISTRLYKLFPKIYHWGSRFRNGITLYMNETNITIDPLNLNSTTSNYEFMPATTHVGNHMASVVKFPFVLPSINRNSKEQEPLLWKLELVFEDFYGKKEKPKSHLISNEGFFWDALLPLRYNNKGEKFFQQDTHQQLHFVLCSPVVLNNTFLKSQGIEGLVFSLRFFNVSSAVMLGTKPWGYIPIELLQWNMDARHDTTSLQNVFKNATSTVNVWDENFDASSQTCFKFRFDEKSGFSASMLSSKIAYLEIQLVTFNEKKEYENENNVNSDIPATQTMFSLPNINKFFSYNAFNNTKQPVLIDFDDKYRFNQSTNFLKNQKNREADVDNNTLLCLLLPEQQHSAFIFNFSNTLINKKGFFKQLPTAIASQILGYVIINHSMPSANTEDFYDEVIGHLCTNVDDPYSFKNKTFVFMGKECDLNVTINELSHSGKKKEHAKTFLSNMFTYNNNKENPSFYNVYDRWTPLHNKNNSPICSIGNTIALHDITSGENLATCQLTPISKNVENSVFSQFRKNMCHQSLQHQQHTLTKSEVLFREGNKNFGINEQTKNLIFNAKIAMGGISIILSVLCIQKFRTFWKRWKYSSIPSTTNTV